MKNIESSYLRILVVGSSGLIGSAVVSHFRKAGHHVIRLIRGHDANVLDCRVWDPEVGLINTSDIDSFDVVINLAGENIAGRWTKEKKQRILQSRVNTTRVLCEALQMSINPPQVLINASAVGYYGDRGEEILKEESPSGEGFLAEVCREWEAATYPAEARGVRVVNLRIGMVLAPNGGALKQLLLPFKLGLGGVIGSGKQYISWIALDDLVGVINQAIFNESLSGPVNAVTPHPVTNYEFTRTLGKVLGRPTFLPLPAFVAELVFGEMAKELLLSSERVQPAKLEKNGYHFYFPELESALRHILNVGA